MKSFISIAALALLATMPGVIAHIDMQDPPPIRHKNNKNAVSVDTDYTAPVKELCKGYHKLGGADLTPVATWEAGSQQKFTLGGSAVHGGGSCQASISEDGGNTFKAIKSWIGECPGTKGNAGTFDFTVPKDTKNGDVLFAWTWFNKIGNREMYMNCASIKITGGGSGLGSGYPDILVANIGNGCTTVDNQDIAFPNPGKEVENNYDPNTKPAPPTGSCGSAAAPPPPGNSPPADTPKEEPTDEESPTETTPPVAPPPSQTTPPVAPPPSQTTPPVVPPKDTPPSTKPPANGGSCSNEKQIICNSETTWSLCTNGVAIFMGNVAPGTKCTDGEIKKRDLAKIRFSKNHMKARKF